MAETATESHNRIVRDAFTTVGRAVIAGGGADPEMMGSDIATAFARRLRANADRAEALKFSVANLSTMSVADCRALAQFLDDASEFVGAAPMAAFLRRGATDGA